METGINNRAYRAILRLIQAYQYAISPLLGNNCRFTPSCSNYALQAIKKYGAKGIFLSLKRIGKCNPFVDGGYDPVK